MRRRERRQLARKKKKEEAKAEPRLDSWRKRLEGPGLQIAVVALLVLVVYWPSLGAGFHFDDFATLRHPYVAGPGLGLEPERMPPTRQLTYLTLHWNYLAGGTDPRGYHWVNLLLHVGNALLVLLIARACLSPLTALLAGALFALHPLQTQAVNYIYQRATLLAAFFALLSFLLFLRQRYGWSVAAFVLSLLAKVETMALPVFLLAYDLLGRRRRPRWLYYVFMFGLPALAAGRILYIFNSPAATIGFRMEGMPAVSYALTQTRVVWTYLRLFFFPVGLNIDHDVPISQGLFSPPTTVVALLGLAVVIAALGWLAWRGKQPALWALGFFLLLAPTSSVVPLRDVIFEHRTYFPLVCLVLAAAMVLARLPRGVLGPTVAVVLVALLAGTVTRNRAWQSSEALWADALAKSPGLARPYVQLATVYASSEPRRCREVAERGLGRHPNNADLHNQLGTCMMALGDAEGALEHFQRATALAGSSVESLNNIGAALLRLGRPEEAAKSFGHALKRNACSANTRINYTSVLWKLGKSEEALAAIEPPATCQFTLEETESLRRQREQMRSGTAE